MACSNSFCFSNSENEPWIESSSKKKYWKTKPSPKKDLQEESFEQGLRCWFKFLLVFELRK